MAKYALLNTLEPEEMNVMAAFSLRDKWGLGAAAGVALSLAIGGWAYNSMGSGTANSAPLRPQTAAAATAASLDLPAGGGVATAAAGAVVSAPSPTTNEKLMVHVTGSVKVPGVYTLKPGDRINDAIKAAGGFKTNAQQDALNLADTVRDADQIFVPAQVPIAPAAKGKLGGQTAQSRCGSKLVQTRKYMTQVGVRLEFCYMLFPNPPPRHSQRPQTPWLFPHHVARVCFP